MSEYRIIPDRSLTNREDICNNPNCPRPTIFWNPSVVHPQTGRSLPLNEPFTMQRPPQRHKCMISNPPPKYISKYSSAAENRNKIDFSLAHIRYMILTKTEPTDEVRRIAKIPIVCPNCGLKTEPYYMKIHSCEVKN